MSEKTQKMSKSIPEFAKHGVDFAVGAAVQGVCVQAAQVTQVGASPFTLVFATYGLSDMADTKYVCIVGGDTAGAPKVTQASMSTKQVIIKGGGDTEVLHLLLVGRIKGTPDANGNP